MRILKILAVALMAGLLAASFALPAAAAGKAKAAFVYVGPIGDHGWTYAHNQGRLGIEKKLGIETAFIENVAEANAERVINNFARRGYSPIFTTSFGYMDATLAVAKKFPKTAFMHCSGFKRSANVGTYFGRMYQARYLTGLLAGAMTKSNVIGYVNAFPIPECIRLANAFALGVREANPKAKVHVVWINSWTDSAKGKEAAKALLSVGADVLTQGIDPPGPQEAAVEAGKWYIGWDSDMTHLAPKHTLSCAVWNWVPLYTKLVKQVQDGTWKPADYYNGMETGIIDITPIGSMVPKKVKDMVMKRRQEIIDGKFKIFTGPIKYQDGSTMLKKGEVASDKLLLSGTKFIEGVVGTVK